MVVGCDHSLLVAPFDDQHAFEVLFELDEATAKQAQEDRHVIVGRRKGFAGGKAHGFGL